MARISNTEWDIYIMNVDGMGQANLSNHAGSNTEAAWSPDGSHIAFMSARDGNWEIYVMRADGTDQKNLTNNTGGDFNPRWSPDGTRIAF